MKTLTVYYHGKRIGVLSQDAWGAVAFRYNAEWLSDPHAHPISQSLPLQKEVFNERECIGFFGGLLPEDHNRELIARNLGISAGNDYGILKEIGGECAGAISFLDPEIEPSEPTHTYHSITPHELEKILDTLPQKPLLAGQAEVRLSLAGAQNKLALFMDENGFSLPLHESPSSHIVKPEAPLFPGLVENETYCLRLAKRVGLPTAEAAPLIVGKHRCLLVTRYDRFWKEGHLFRLHQEDFCQALGVPSRLKYQSEGGPHLVHCFDLLRSASSRPARDLVTLFHTVLFNYLIGNNDAHAKNFSLLHVPSGKTIRIELAPLYDLVSTASFPRLSGKMAMKIGSKYIPNDLRIRHWEAYWKAIGFSPKQALRQTRQFMEKMEQVFPNSTENQITETIQASIKKRLIALHRTLK